MIITYKIPSGVMRIDANEFFEAAKKSQIRRMLKQLRQDERAVKDCKPLIWDYLEAQVQEAHYKAAPKSNISRQNRGEGKMKVIKKKILPEYFRAVRAREKNFEIRKDEDDIRVGDLLILEEWDELYTGNSVRRYVKYVLRDSQDYGLMPGYCVIGW